MHINGSKNTQQVEELLDGHHQILRWQKSVKYDNSESNESEHLSLSGRKSLCPTEASIYPNNCNKLHDSLMEPL